jgi:hypothetical protein
MAWRTAWRMGWLLHTSNQATSRVLTLDSSSQKVTAAVSPCALRSPGLLRSSACIIPKVYKYLGTYRDL